MNSLSKIIFLSAFFFVLLLFRFVTTYHNRSKYNNGQYLVFETTLLSEPLISGKYQRLFVNQNFGERILVTIPRYPELHYADTVRISGLTGASSQKTQLLTMFLPKVEAVETNSGLAVASFVRQKIIALFEKTLPQTHSSLLLGIVFGIKEGMPKEFMEALRLSGVLHVIAASGMNVTMTAGFLSLVFSALFRRQIAVFLSILGILFYAVLSGLEPSILRATIMGILGFSAQILGRQALAFYSLVLAGYAMLFVSPSLLLDVGFQLSFVSTLGLLSIKPLFEKGLKGGFSKVIIGEDVATTISAQIATLPILLANFGTYSFWSILVNGLVLWTIPILMILGGIGAVLGLVFAPLGQILLYASLPLLVYFEKVVGLFGGFGGVIDISSLPWQFIVGYYCLLGAVVLVVCQKRDG